MTLTSVKGNYGEELYSFFQCATLLDVPWDIRLQRVKGHSFQKFGIRMLSGGDLFEQEEKFFALLDPEVRIPLKEGKSYGYL